MHYYTFNIGDYASHTKGLTLLEDLAYRRLLDEYYLTERPLNGCSTDVARMIGMRGNEQEVDYVLRSFFTKNDEGFWINARADREIQHFKSKSEKSSRAGKASAERRLNERSTNVQRMFNGCSTNVQPTNNQQPITNNQNKEINNKDSDEEKKNKKQQAARATRSNFSKPSDVDEKVWNDWLQHRKLKKAVVTETVLKTIRREALQASMTLQDALETMCTRGWTGFKAEWMKSNGRQSVQMQNAFDDFLDVNNIIEFDEIGGLK
jgi:uncharacterized protein YdaU (DUF1376 family)